MEANLEIAERAIAEHACWMTRNAARAAMRSFYAAFEDRTGEWFVEDIAEPGELTEWKRLRDDMKTAQSKLATARAATRRAIAKATGRAE